MRALLPLLVVSAGFIHARTWTDVQGRTLEADMVSATDDSVVVKLKGRDVTIPLSKLSEGDREYVASRLEEGAGKVAATPAGGLQFDGKPLEPGAKMHVYEYPYPAEVLQRVVKKHKGKDTGFKIAIAVPAGFDPARPQRVFIANTAVNNDAQARSGNLGVFGMYAATCVENGWVCLAYDTDIGRSNHNADLLEAFRVLNGQWPGIKTWRFAVGGFSGGAKACFDPLAYLLKEGYPATGAFLGGCNSAANCGEGRGRYKASSGGYRKLKAFISTGKTDALVSADQVESVIATLKDEGVRKVKSEFFDGGHAFCKPHFQAALQWFGEAEE